MGDYSQLLQAEDQKKLREQPLPFPVPAPRPEPSPVTSSLEENPISREFVNKSTSEQISKSTNQQVNKSASPQMYKSTNVQVNKSTKRFGTYLTEDSIRAMKRLALDTDKNDYEVFQEAVDAYLKKHGY